MKKKKRAPSPRRRHPYERCLEHALARLTKAVSEKQECNEKLASLEKEIPYLEAIVHALTPPTSEQSSEQSSEQLTVGTVFRRSTSGRWPISIAVPDHLKRFLEPATETATMPQSEDDTLREPGGTPLLD